MAMLMRSWMRRLECGELFWDLIWTIYETMDIGILASRKKAAQKQCLLAIATYCMNTDSLTARVQDPPSALAQNCLLSILIKPDLRQFYCEALCKSSTHPLQTVQGRLCLMNTQAGGGAAIVDILGSPPLLR